MYHTYSNTIMDVQPIATKEGESEIGSGVTRVLDGVVMMVTGTDANGVQIGEFGSSEGFLDENIMWGRPGAPEKGEIFIKTEVIIKEGTNMERPGPLAAHTATDVITQEIREALKKVDDSLVVDTRRMYPCTHMYRTCIQRDVQTLLEGAACSGSAPRRRTRSLRCPFCRKPADQCGEILCIQTCRTDGRGTGC